MPQYDLLNVLQPLVVSLRGWPVPFIDGRQPPLAADGWIGEDIDARTVSHEEAWRFFTTGQFTQLRVISADRRISAEGTPVPAAPHGVIEVWEILYYLTEIVEFAARLAASSAGDDAITVVATLHGMADRRLVAGTPAHELDRDYRSHSGTISEKRTYRREQLQTDKRRLAVEMSRSMLAKFGFNATERVLSDYQLELTHAK